MQANGFVGITTVFSSHGNYLLDAEPPRCRSSGTQPSCARRLSLQSSGCGRKRPGVQATRCLVFHAFTQLRQETAEAVITAVAGMGLSGVKFAFLHVAEYHPFTLFDHAFPVGKGAAHYNQRLRQDKGANLNRWAARFRTQGALGRRRGA